MISNRHYISSFLNILFLFIICNVSLSAQNSISNKSNISDTIVICGYSDFAPYVSLNEKGEPEGYNVDLMKALMNELGMSYSFELSDIRSSIDMVLNNKADIIMGVSYSHERNKDLSFGVPISYINRLMISPVDKPIDNRNQLKDKRILVQSGAITESYVRNLKLSDTIIASKYIRDLIMMLLQGKGDVIFVGDQAAYYIIKKMGLEKKFHFASVNMEPLKFTFAVKRGNDDLLFRLNEGVVQLQKNGAYDEIYNKWFKIDEPNYFQPVYIKVNLILIIFFIITLILVFILWRISVRSKRKIVLNELKSELALKAGNISTFTYNKKTGDIISISRPIISSGVTKLDDMINLFEEEDRIKIVEAIKRLNTNISDEETIRLKMKYNIAFPNVKYLECHMIAVNNGYLESSLILGSMKNITNEIEEQIELDNRRVQAEKLSMMKSAFLVNISHDLRSPLNGIVGFTDILASDYENEVTPEEKNQMAQMVRQNANTITTLINDMLDMAKFESGTYQVRLEKANIYMICKTVVESNRSKTNDGVKLIFAPEDKDYLLCTDVVRTQQVLSNFISNACKYTKEGSIELDYKVCDDMVRFSVTDTGCGIDKKDAEICFERFRMLDNSVAGTGLGLHICKLIANLLHGKVYVDTSYTSGARFIFEHPCNLQDIQ